MDLSQKPLKFNSSPEKYGNFDWKTIFFGFGAQKVSFQKLNSLLNFRRCRYKDIVTKRPPQV